MRGGRWGHGLGGGSAEEEGGEGPAGVSDGNAEELWWGCGETEEELRWGWGKKVTRVNLCNGEKAVILQRFREGVIWGMRERGEAEERGAAEVLHEKGGEAARVQ